MILEFSEYGTKFALFIQKEDKSCQLKVVSIFDDDMDDILKFIEILNNEEQYKNEYVNGKKRLISKDYDPIDIHFEVKRIIFDVNEDCQFLVGLGETDFFIFEFMHE